VQKNNADEKQKKGQSKTQLKEGLRNEQLRPRLVLFACCIEFRLDAVDECDRARNFQLHASKMMRSRRFRCLPSGRKQRLGNRLCSNYFCRETKMKINSINDRHMLSCTATCIQYELLSTTHPFI
jgi:hypothetical protein